MRCANEYSNGCKARGHLFDGENRIHIEKHHKQTCTFNIDAAEQRSALRDKVTTSREGPLKDFKAVRRE